MRGGGRLLLALLPALGLVSLAAGAGGVVQVVPVPVVQAPAGASFAGRQRARVLAASGGAAELRCAVRHLGDRVVSWVRTRDLQILTTAGVVFTGDTRVSAVSAAATPVSRDDDLSELSDYSEGASEEIAVAGASDVSVHTLRIERLRASDAGRYECQVNSEPKMSLMFDLEVVDEEVPHIEVSVVAEGGAGAGGGGEARAARGAAARLKCLARWEPPPRRLPPPPLAIRWLKDGHELDVRSGVSLSTERAGARAVSRLALAALQPRDAGRYRCEANARGSRASSDAITLRVGDIGGADMQRDEAAAWRGRSGGGTPFSAALTPLLTLLAAFLA